MNKSKEIEALFSLIEDPDEEIFVTVSEKIIGYGKEIIPSLENLWETNHDEEIQQRIKSIIHRLHFHDLSEEFKLWAVDEQQELLTGALLVGKYKHPEISTIGVIADLEKVKRNIWLELNNYLTPLEELNIVVSILFNYYNLKPGSDWRLSPNTYLLHHVLTSKEGNQINNGILILILAAKLGIPIKAIQIPGQFILAYFKSDSSNEIEYYLDPSSGLIFSGKHFIDYLTRIELQNAPAYFIPVNNQQVIRTLLLELSKCHKDENDSYKKNELQDLANLLS